MKIVTPGQMGEIDSFTINQIGIPGIVLMENAGLKVVEEAIRLLGTVAGSNIVVFAGKGNNGGDAFVAARHLYNKGANVTVYAVAKKNSIKGDALTNLKALEACGIKVKELLDSIMTDEADRVITACGLVIDGIFGTGIKGRIEGFTANVIGMINASLKSVISIDIPSGIDGETGKILGCCVKAQKTVTFGLPKIGLILNPGCEFTGELVTADIGIPKKSIEYFNIKSNITDNDFVSRVIPARKPDSNKGDYGKVLAITGSVGMTGAGCLAAEAALRSGAGLLYMGVPAVLSSIYDTLLRESVTIPLEDGKKGCLSRESIKQILGYLEKVTTVAVGPGLSVNDDIIEIIGSIIRNSRVPIVLDADALNALAHDVSVLKEKKAEIVITPHPGEMAKLTGRSISEIQENRIGEARQFASMWGVVTVLKGAKTVAALPDGTVYINPTGNSGMATAGAGDVLTGIIAGLIGQGARPDESAVAGVYLHGMAGDMAAAKKGKHGMIAGDILEELPGAILEVGDWKLEVRRD